MEGEKLSQARRACLAAFRVLRAQDRFSLVAFSTELQVLLSDRTAESISETELNSLLAGLGAQGITRTDLVLNWMKERLMPQNGPRFGILATDGRPTNLRGQALEEFGEFEKLAQELGVSGVSLSSIGLGDAENFYPRFLLDLADRGQGRFIHATSESELTEQLRGHFARATAVGAERVEVVIEPLLARLGLAACCQIAPEFRPIDCPTPEAGPWTVRIHNVPGKADTDFLFHFKLPKTSFGEKSGQKSILRVSAVADSVSTPAQEVHIEYVASIQEEQQINDGVVKARKLWDLNTCQDAVMRSDDLYRTGRLLQRMVESAEELGVDEVAENARAQLGQLEQQGKFDPNSGTRNTQILRDLGSTF